MKLDRYINLDKMLGVSGLFSVIGSFGMIDGDAHYSVSEEENAQRYTYSNGKVELCATFTEYPDGVVIRQDSLKNISSDPIVINHLVSRFRVKGNKYQVYTQFNGWQHESDGAWQPLVTEVSVASRGIRSCDGTTPLLALRDEYSGKCSVFHLLPNCQWKMTAKKMPIYSDREVVVVETGFCDEGLCFNVKPEEKIFLPEIIFYQAENATDLDAYKLHKVYNELYPRKSLPVLYNSWLYCYDYLDIDALLRQVDVASALGIEAFMIDAGWFGEGDGWSERVGDWSENTTGGPRGRMIEIAERVREKGMIFGLWFEPERVGALSRARSEHPEFCIKGRFFDFANPDARAYMADVISSQIEKYGIGWVKFDFNDTIPYDESGCAFYYYLQGQQEFIKEMKRRYPDLYITNCASGGYRMEMEQGKICDSFWLSDNQGPVEGIRIVKDTIKRMPSSLIERWCVQKYCEGFLKYGQEAKVGHMIYCNNGTWDSLTTVSDSYAKAFMTGGPVGLSFDLEALPEAYKEFWRSAIDEYKANRELYAKGSARILADSDGIIAIEYFDDDFENCIIQVFSNRCFATDIVLYPVVDEGEVYICDGERLSGNDIRENGVVFNKLSDRDCKILHLTKEKSCNEATH